ncbi:hypothetical protein F5X96DRAFT_304626 [Biscogniauxia mediterranea]|nr:hypothetical protein F5X96DRAFT_304626 [Biscogniauxia mediterranea]
MADRYVIRVTAGSDYDMDQHVVVPVNTPDPVKINSELMDIDLNVRVQNYHGLPPNSPTTSPYFSLEPHAANQDQYSIAIRFTPKRPPPGSRASSSTAASAAGSRSSSQSRQSTSSSSRTSSLAARLGRRNTGSKQSSSSSGASKSDSTSSGSGSSTPDPTATGISGHDLQFGNDFDHPIRDRLPPGFGYAMNIVKWWIDPGLEGDAYADRPYLYGPALSSFNAVHAGRGGGVDAAKGGLHFEEGGDEEGIVWRRDVAGAPDGAKERKAWALKGAGKDRWVFEYGRTYCADFFNPYLDFNEFALRLPGFTLPIMKYWDGQSLSTKNAESENKKQPKRSHALRYVLRNRSTGDTYLVVVFTLYLREDIDEDGELKPEAREAIAREQHAVAGGKGFGRSREEALEDDGAKDDSEGIGDKDKEEYDEARKQLGELDIGKEKAEEKTSKDDVD